MEVKAATTLLHEPFKFKIKGKQYAIAGLYLATLIKMSRLLTLIKFDQSRLKTEPIQASAQALEQNAFLVARIVAIAILNNPVKIWLFSRLLALRLYYTVDNFALRQLVDAIVSQTGYMDFIISIASLQGLSVTAPKRGTSPNGTGETIAPGE